MFPAQAAVEIYIVVRSLGGLVTLSPAYHACASAVLRTNFQPSSRATNGGGVDFCMLAMLRTSPVLLVAFDLRGCRGQRGNIRL
jgi:hypothetical protein